MEYLLLFVLVLYGAYTYDIKKSLSFRNQWYLLECIIMILLMGLRYKVGGDTLIYFDFYKSSSDFQHLSLEDFDSAYSPGWIVLNALCKSYFDDFCFVQLIQSTFVNAVLFSFFKKYSDYKFTAVVFYFLFYYITYNTEIMRAAISVSIFLLAYRHYLNGNWRIYSCVFVIAFIFHPESIVMLLLPVCKLLQRMEISIISVLSLIFISLLCSVTFDFIPQIGNYLSGFEMLESKFSRYSAVTYDINIFGFAMAVILILPWTFMVLLDDNIDKRNIRGFVLLFIIISILSVKYNVFMSRLCDFLYPFLIIYITKSIYEMKKIKDQISLFVFKLFLLLCVYTNVSKYFVNEHWKLFYPYYSVFNPIDDTERYDFLLEIQSVE